MTGLVRARPNSLAGIALLTAAAMGFAALDTATKVAFFGVSVMLALQYRYAFQAAITNLSVLPKRGLALPSMAHPKLQFLRGRLLWPPAVVYFSCLLHMPVNRFTAIIALASLTLFERALILR